MTHTYKSMLTGATITDADILACWDRSKCGDPDAGCPGSDPNGWDSDKGWSVVTPEDARLAMSSAPIFGVGDLQGYWRSRDAARQRCADAINADRMASGLAMEHEAAGGCECQEGPDGMCAVCGVEMSVCDACHGIGYHRAGCALTDG